MVWRQAVGEKPDLRAGGEINSDNQRQIREAARMLALQRKDMSPTPGHSAAE